MLGNHQNPGAHSNGPQSGTFDPRHNPYVPDETINFLYTHVNPEVWRPTTPRYVRRICRQIARERHISFKGLLATWEAIKNLIVFKGGGQLHLALGQREIAAEADVCVNSLTGPTGYIRLLVNGGLIEIVGQQEVKGHAGKPLGKKLPPCNIYCINLPRLEKLSIDDLETIYREQRLSPPDPVVQLAEQLQLDPANGTGTAYTVTADGTGEQASVTADGTAFQGSNGTGDTASGRSLPPQPGGSAISDGTGGQPTVHKNATASPTNGTGDARLLSHFENVERKTKRESEGEEGDTPPPSPDSSLHPHSAPDTELVALRQRVQDLEALVRAIPAQILAALRKLLPGGTATPGATDHEPDQRESPEQSTVTVTRTDEPVQLHVGTVKRQIAPPHPATARTTPLPQEPSPLSTVPSTPAGAMPLRQPVQALFAALSGSVASHANAIRLQALADEIDAAAGGFGLYWLGRAILLTDFCLLDKDRTHFLTYLRTMLRRWMHEGSWGSDRGDPPRTLVGQGSDVTDQEVRPPQAPQASNPEPRTLPPPAATPEPVKHPDDDPDVQENPVVLPAHHVPVTNEHAEAVLRIWKDVGGHEKAVADLTETERSLMVNAVRDLEQWRDFLAYWVSSIPEHDPSGRKPKKRYNPGRIPDLVRAFAQYVQSRRAPPDKTEILLSGLPPTEMERWLDRFQRAVGDVIAQERVLTDLRAFLATYTPPAPSPIALRPALPKARRAQLRAQRAQRAQHTDQPPDTADHETPCGKNS